MTMTIFQCTGTEDLMVSNCHRVTKLGNGGWSLLLFPKGDAMLTGGSSFKILLNIKTQKEVGNLSINKCIK